MIAIKNRARETKQLLYDACTHIDKCDTTPIDIAKSVHTARQLTRLLHDLLDKSDPAPPYAATDLIANALSHLKKVVDQIRLTHTRDQRAKTIDPLAWAAIQSAFLILKTIERDLT